MIQHLVPVGLFANWYSNFSVPSGLLLLILSSVMVFFSICVMNTSYKRDGNKWKSFQHLKIWKVLKSYFTAGITVQTPLNNDQQYIFCSFPHGACNTHDILPLFAWFIFDTASSYEWHLRHYFHADKSFLLFYHSIRISNLCCYLNTCPFCWISILRYSESFPHDDGQLSDAVRSAHWR